MEKISKWTMDNKIIVIIIIVIIILFVWLFAIPRFSVEGLENVGSNNSGAIIMNSLINKNVYIATQLGNSKYYLTIVNKQNCNAIKDIAINECQFNIPILVPAAQRSDAFSIFEIDRNVTGNKYTIRSINKDLNRPNLTQNLNFYKNIDKLCFDNNKDDDVIYLD